MRDVAFCYGVHMLITRVGSCRRARKTYTFIRHAQTGLHVVLMRVALLLFILLRVSPDGDRRRRRCHIRFMPRRLSLFHAFRHRRHATSTHAEQSARFIF